MLKKLLILLSCIFSIASYAQDKNAHTEVIEKIKRIAANKGLDRDVFLALIMHESGDPKLNNIINPYALNIGGYSYYPKDKAAAYRLIINAKLKGEKQLGIGLGQIEWRFHKKHFNSALDALDEDQNLNIASDYFFKMLMKCNGDTWCAVGNYHSQNKNVSRRYVELVKEKWNLIKI